jgi:hypothetical protein
MSTSRWTFPTYSGCSHILQLITIYTYSTGHTIWSKKYSFCTNSASIVEMYLKRLQCKTTQLCYKQRNFDYIDQNNVTFQLFVRLYWKDYPKMQITWPVIICYKNSNTITNSNKNSNIITNSNKNSNTVTNSNKISNTITNPNKNVVTGTDWLLHSQ